MLTALVNFILMALVLMVVLFIVKYFIDYLEVDPKTRQFALACVGLLGLVILIFMMVQVFTGNLAVIRVN